MSSDPLKGHFHGRGRRKTGSERERETDRTELLYIMRPTRQRRSLDRGKQCFCNLTAWLDDRIVGNHVKEANAFFFLSEHVRGSHDLLNQPCLLPLPSSDVTCLHVSGCGRGDAVALRWSKLCLLSRKTNFSIRVCHCTRDSTGKGCCYTQEPYLSENAPERFPLIKVRIIVCLLDGWWLQLQFR